MRKIIAMLLIFALAFCSCKKKKIIDDTSATNVPSTTSLSTTSSAEITDPVGPSEIFQADMFAAALPCTQTQDVTDDGNVIFTKSIQHLQLQMPDPEVVNKIVIDFGSRQDLLNQAADNARATAMQNNADGSSTNYFYHAFYNHVRIDENVLSLSGTAVQNTGGIHPLYSCIYANYDMVHGDRLTLGSILTHADRASDLCQLLIDETTSLITEYNIDEELYETYIHNRFTGDISEDDSWYFSSEGLCFSFAPGEIAPYSSRIVTITIPYEKLTNIIGDEYFPVERDIASGAVNGALLTEDNAMLFSQTAEIIISETGEMVLLSTDKSVYDVCIEVGRWDYGVFDLSYVALARSALTPGDAIMLQADLPESESPIRISYRSNDQVHYAYITLVNGTVVLTPEE